MPVRVFHPLSVHVRIAAGCNLGCVFCERELLPMAGQTGRRKRGTLTFPDGRADLPIDKDMDAATWELVKEKFMPHVTRMELGGLGEPTLGKLFAQAATEIVEAGKQLFFFTNGHFLFHENILAAVGETPHVSVSIDAGTPEAYKRIRKGDLTAMIKSVSAFREAKPGARMDSQFTAVASNVEEIPKWVELCARLGIGRTAHGEQLLLIGADHHATSRVDSSVRFMRDRTLAAVDAAREIAQREGLWFVANLPKFSENNPNAIEDNSDPRKLRRWSDLLFGEANPCGGGSDPVPTVVTGDTSVIPTKPINTDIIIEPSDFDNTLIGAPLHMVESAAREFGHPPAESTEGEAREILTAPREVYVDYDGTVWECLARHAIGDIRTGTWESIIEENAEYQAFLANWYYGTSNDNTECRSCPRRK